MISGDWSSDVCSSDLCGNLMCAQRATQGNFAHYFAVGLIVTPSLSCMQILYFLPRKGRFHYLRIDE